MTTFQDPPPQSRRAVRQSERGETPDQPPTDAAPQKPYEFDGERATPADEAPVAPAEHGTHADHAGHGHHSGRRAQQPPPLDPVAAGFEPLNYVTQGRVRLPEDHLPSAEQESHGQEFPQQGAPQHGIQPPLENRVAPPPSDDYSQDNLATQPPPGQVDEPGYRVRDFSPEGRRTPLSREQFAGVSQAPAPTFAPPVVPAPVTEPVDLDYHTQGVSPSGSHAAQPPQADETMMNHTLTRRELRELRAAQEAAAPQLRMPEPIDALLNSGPIELPTLAPPPGQSQALADAMAEFDSLTRARREADAAARDAQVASLAAPAPAPAPLTSPVAAAPPPSGAVSVPIAPPATGPLDQPVAELVEPPAPEPVSFENGLPKPIFFDEPASEAEPASEPESEPAPEFEPTPSVQPFGLATTPDVFAQASVPSVASAPVAPAAPPAPTEQAVPIAPPAAVQASVPAPQPAPPLREQQAVQPPAASADPLFLEPERAPATRPTGHWSVQAEQDDDGVPYDNALSRTVGTGTSAITTSALVLPSVPQANDLTRPLTATGEILVTGSIDLPRSLGSTGAHPHRVDNSDFEDDPLDSQVSSADSAPVRAIRAVSTHTSTRGVIESKKPQSNRLLTIGITAASVLVIGVVGLLVWALATGQFNS